jgi:hypothetical protein
VGNVVAVTKKKHILASLYSFVEGHSASWRKKAATVEAKTPHQTKHWIPPDPPPPKKAKKKLHAREPEPPVLNAPNIFIAGPEVVAEYEKRALRLVAIELDLCGVCVWREREYVSVCAAELRAGAIYFGVQNGKGVGVGVGDVDAVRKESCVWCNAVHRDVTVCRGEWCPQQRHAAPTHPFPLQSERWNSLQFPQ